MAVAVAKQAGIPDLVQVRELVAEELELDVVAAAVATVADVHRLVGVLDEVDHVPQGHPPPGPGAWGSARTLRNSSSRETTQLSWQSREE